MGGFSEDQEIKVSKLVRLWVAEGFLKPSRGSKSYEELGEECLEDLVKRSLVLVVKRTSSGKIKSCGFHDLVRDLCVRKAKEEHIVSISFSKVHLSGRENLSDFTFLRVLDVVQLKTLNGFPNILLELFLLRYLAFSITPSVKIFVVPSSILKLQNLQTIFISWELHPEVLSRHRLHLPLEIWRMTQLRHLLLPTIPCLPYPYAISFALENLHTLAVRNFQFSERILEMIPNLRKLDLVYSPEIKLEDCHLDNLVNFHRLEKLSIGVQCSRDCGDIVRFSGNLTFPVMLKTLKLRGLELCSRDMEIFGLLPNLEVLRLRECSYEGGKWETNEGEFLQLKSLQIMHTNLEEWVINESSHFPRLERLMLYGCYKLSEVPEVIVEIPTLEVIEMSRWDEKCLVESVKRMKEEQESDGNDSLQVRVVDHDYEYWW